MSDKGDELASDVDDAMTSVDELKNDPGSIKGKSIHKVKDALQEAKDEVDKMEARQNNGPSTSLCSTRHRVRDESRPHAPLEFPRTLMAVLATEQFVSEHLLLPRRVHGELQIRERFLEAVTKPRPTSDA